MSKRSSYLVVEGRVSAISGSLMARLGMKRLAGDAKVTYGRPGMRLHEKCLAGLLTVGLIAGCSGGSDVSQPEPLATATGSGESTPTDSVASPTLDPADSITDQDRIDAAMAHFDTEVTAGEIDEVATYDLIDVAIDADGLVTMQICSWSGESVFDEIREPLLRTIAEPDGTIRVEEITTPRAMGECLNSELIDTALDHINKFDAFWTEMSVDPSTFAGDPRQALLEDQYLESSTGLVNGWVDSGNYYLGARVSGDIRDTAVAEVLWRRFDLNGVQVLEVAVCRDMSPDRGLYRDGVLIDNGKSAEASGPHSVDSIQLVADPSVPRGWLVAGEQSLIWADCINVDSWIQSANDWQPRETEFEVLES